MLFVSSTVQLNLSHFAGISGIFKGLQLTTGLQNRTKEIQKYRTTRLQNYRATGLQNFRTTGLHDYRTTGLQDYIIVRE